MPDHVGERVRVAGLPCASRRVDTKASGPMLFLTLADSSGLAVCVLLPGVCRSYAAATRGQIVCAEGRVDETLGAVTVTVERAEVMLA
ncbi:MAG: hypothetical protein E6K78_08400 [Candidatus Eisenbacteria bacterium]|uniref:OB domain-containing protein n=1 Tax=Eiseniibacteriota bacterium TaxID=2212470 RepID=A0A538TMZ6_UNCEI|nr:MAG: hypothetical protein E6K78_08400 [Candidatus Eisenbacteria bacterium]